ncbi:MAG TPA: glycosyltransferase [Chloroflexia bacterium]|nr:glycosyltransferase [Chloroflexia bacterium]
MKPQLSILIPTRNRRHLLARTLASLSRQSTPPGTFEVIVASDGSTDGTPEAIQQIASLPAWSGRTLLCLEQEWRGASAARNTALRAASGDIVLYLDDDVVAHPDLVAEHLRRHKEVQGNDLVVLGRIIPERRPEAIHRQLRLWWRGHYTRLEGKPATFGAFFTGNVSLPREAALAVGGLDENIDYVEDVEFGYRLAKQGLTFAHEPGATALTHNPKAPAAVLRDLYRIGQGNVHMYRKFPETLPDMPLSAYGETNLRMRVALRLLLGASRVRPAGFLINFMFERWAASTTVRKLDRQMFELARAYYFWRGVRAEVSDQGEWARLSSPGVPVLTYHSVERMPSIADDRYTVSTTTFGRQMSLLKLMRYRVEPLAKIVDTWNAGELPEPRAVALTFDDGYVDNSTDAWPVLRKMGYPATLFFVTGLAGRASLWDESLTPGPKPLLPWHEAIRLDHEGFKVEAHSVNHPDLAAIPPEAAEQEVTGSKRDLEEHLGRTVELFAYPYGHYNAAVRDHVQRSGYRAAFSVARGLNTLKTDRFALRRVTISGDDNLLMFALKVWAGDDPLRFIPGFSRITNRERRRGRKRS